MLTYTAPMKKDSPVLLQVVTVLIGMSALAFMLWEPHLEGRNVGATLFEIYFKDPFLAYVYVSSISFFVALSEVYKLLGYVKHNKIFSPAAVKAVRTIKYCARTLVGFVVAAEAYLFIFNRGNDDIAGGVFMGLLMIFVFGIIAIVATMFERLLQNAVDMKSKNDVTV